MPAVWDCLRAAMFKAFLDQFLHWSGTNVCRFDIILREEISILQNF